MTDLHVVEVLGTNAGSGLLLGGGLVLTAAHLVSNPASQINIRRASEEHKYLARSVWSKYQGPDRGLDAAILEILDPDWPDEETTTIQWAKLKGSAEVRAHAFGYPDAMLRAGRPELSPVTGHLHTLSGIDSGRAEIVIDGEPNRTANGISLWSGLSGGPVMGATEGVTEDVFLGIIVGDPNEFASRRLRMVTASAILGEADAVAILESTLEKLQICEYPRSLRSHSQPSGNEQDSPRARELSGRIIFGEIPQRAPYFQERLNLEDQITKSGSAEPAISMVIGSRGTGKTQIAGQIARHRLGQRWRLVAWISAENPSLMIKQFSLLAGRLGLASDDSDETTAALRLRNWLEEDGSECLLVFDNAVEATALRFLLPVAGKSHVVVTTTKRSLANLGRSVGVECFDLDQAAAYLIARTGRDDKVGARDVSADLGCLPLALSQAGAVIAGQRIDYQTYRNRLARVQLSDYLTSPDDDPYPIGVAESIMLSIAFVESLLSGILSRKLLDFISLLSPSGISRDLLYFNSRPTDESTLEKFALEPSEQSTAPSIETLATDGEIDAALQLISDTSLLTWSLDGTTLFIHALVRRVLKERAVHDGTIFRTMERAIDVVVAATGNLTSDNVTEWISHARALVDHESVDTKLLDDLHRGRLASLIAYSAGMQDGLAEGTLRRAQIMETQGQLGDAIIELWQLLGRVGDDKQYVSPRTKSQIESEFERMLTRRKGLSS